MPLAVRHRADPAPLLTPLPGLEVRPQSDPVRMAALQGRTVDEIATRFAAGHRAYVASIDGAPAAWGWVATASATIGELQASFRLVSRERYLWNFVTLAAHRGRGIYPRLLDAIVAAESLEADRFWIAYAPENHASGIGMRKAGFRLVAELSFDTDGRPAVRAMSPGGGAIAAAVLGVPEVAAPVAPCWKCVRAQVPEEMACADGACSCDYQVKDRSCAR